MFPSMENLLICNKTCSFVLVCRKTRTQPATKAWTLLIFDNLFFCSCLQNHNNSNNNTNTTSNQNINNLQQHQKMLRWDVETNQRAVGSPVVGTSPPADTSFQHQTISRRNSNPVTSERISMSPLVSSVSTLILGNIREQQQQQQVQPVIHRKLDRSQSEPAPSALLTAANAKAANINTSRYKTELCRPFEESGSCKYGDKCQFAHGAHELRNLVRHPKYKTELCRTFHTIGFCPYGPRCHFIHNADEARTKVPGSQAVAAPSPAVTTTSTAGIPNRPKPLNLAGSPFMVTGSTADSPSPTSSLSQSPTTSVGSFFSSEQDVFPTVTVMSAASPPPASTSANTAFSFGQDFTSLVHLGGTKQSSPPASPPVSTSPAGSLSPRGSPPPSTPEARLPVFNRLSSTMMDFGGFAELLAWSCKIAHLVFPGWRSQQFRQFPWNYLSELQSTVQTQWKLLTSYVYNVIFPLGIISNFILLF